MSSLEGTVSFEGDRPIPLLAEKEAASYAMTTIIERKCDFPSRLQPRIDEAVEKNLGPDAFVRGIEEALFDLFCENEGQEVLDESKGLHCDRDTEAQVEFAIRMFPEVLFRVHTKSMTRPIHCQLFNGCVTNRKAVVFVPLFARLEKEFGRSRYECVVGGFHSHGFMGRVLLLLGSYDVCGENGKEHQQLVDETFLSVMKRLQNMGLFRKEDISNFNMVNFMLDSTFPYREKRFRYMVDWDPQSMLTSPGHYTILYSVARDCDNFRRVFAIANQILPKETGGLFHKSVEGDTPFQIACKSFGRTKCETILDEFLDDRNCLQSFVFAAINERVHLDGLYTLLRKDPSVLMSAMRPNKDKNGFSREYSARGEGPDKRKRMKAAPETSAIS